MNIKSVVRVDLSGYVELGYLAIRDREIRQVIDRLGFERPSAYVVDIGAASVVEWDRRLVEVLDCGADVHVVGDVESAVVTSSADLRDRMAVPSPRSAS